MSNLTFHAAIMCASTLRPSERSFLSGIFRSLRDSAVISDTDQTRVRDLLTALGLWQDHWNEWPHD